MSLLKEVYLTNEEAQIISGTRDSNLEYIEELMGVEIFARGNILKIKGQEKNVENTAQLIENIKNLVRHKRSLTNNDILKITEQYLKDENGAAIPSTSNKDTSAILVNSKKQTVIPKSPSQKKYIKAIRNYDLVMGIGPAGTGKTYLAVACGIEMVKQGRFQKIVLSRPAL